jgi:hypothetical protein
VKLIARAPTTSFAVPERHRAGCPRFEPGRVTWEQTAIRVLGRDPDGLSGLDRPRERGVNVQRQRAQARLGVGVVPAGAQYHEPLPIHAQQGAPGALDRGEPPLQHHVRHFARRARLREDGGDLLQLHCVRRHVFRGGERHREGFVAGLKVLRESLHLVHLVFQPEREPLQLRRAYLGLVARAVK